MITSERQLNTAKKKADSLEKSVKKMEKNQKGILAKPALIQTKTILEEIKNDITEYENLLNNGLKAIKIESPEDIILLPVKYRIANHLSREEFAKEVDVSVRMIARYEVGEYTNINGETLKKILHNIPLKFTGSLKKT